MSKVEDLIADVAAARRERDEAIEEKEYAEHQLALLANEMVYEGNSVGWIYSKAKNYGDALLKAWDALKLTGVKCDGNTSVADAILIRGAKVAELVAAAECAYTMLGLVHDDHGKVGARLRAALDGVKP